MHGATLAIAVVGPGKPHLPFPPEDMEFRLLKLDTFVQGGIHLVDGDRRVYRSNVHHGPAFLAVEMGEAGNRLCAVELEDESQVLVEHLLSAALVLFVAKGDPLPVLALVLAEVEDLERPATLDVQKALAGHVDGPAREVAADPAAAQLLGHSERRTGTAEEVGDEVARVR